jgi:hypothetical protein
MNKAGVERIDGSVLAVVNPDGTFSNVRVGNITPGSMRNPVLRTFTSVLTDPACRTKGDGERFEVEIPFTMKLE